LTNQINPYETKTLADVLSELKVQVAIGLTDAEVLERRKMSVLTKCGEKAVNDAHVLEALLGLTAFMLEFTIAASLVLHKYIDVYLISGLMFFNATLGFIQELKAARTVKALKKSLQVFVRVLRNGQWLQTAGNQLVPGDIIRIRTGDFITADAKIINGTAGADESALTGESKLINKNVGAILNAGSVIKNGECSAVVIATGIKTFLVKQPIGPNG